MKWNELNQSVQNGLTIFIPTPNQTRQRQKKRGQNATNSNSTPKVLLKGKTSGRPLFSQDINELQKTKYRLHNDPPNLPILQNTNIIGKNQITYSSYIQIPSPSASSSPLFRRWNLCTYYDVVFWILIRYHKFDQPRQQIELLCPD